MNHFLLIKGAPETQAARRKLGRKSLRGVSRSMTPASLDTLSKILDVNWIIMFLSFSSTTSYSVMHYRVLEKKRKEIKQAEKISC